MTLYRGKHHERQQDVDHADQDAQQVVDEGERPVDDRPADQDLVDQPLLAEDDHPGERPHQDAGPERHRTMSTIISARARLDATVIR